MKRHFLFLTVLLLLGTVLEAAPVSKEAAQQKATDFVIKKLGRPVRSGVRMVSQKLKPATNGEQAYWYVFNVGEQQGFVVVSGDDRTDEILGYADSGSFSEQDMPDNMRSWLQGYADDIKYLDDHGITTSQASQARSMRRSPVLSPIAPLIETMWDQDEPYNLQCPLRDEKLSVTGCVATALAQVMYWYAMNRNARCGSKNIAQYTNGITVDALEAIETFDWDNMQLSYRTLSENESEENLDATEKQQRQAVAQLMRYCGQAVKMNYSPNISSARTSDCASALIDYFGYDDATKHFDRNHYYYADWIQLIYDELANRGPVIYHGQATTNRGHAFVCDGYDYDDYFHINWGWSGSSNGYFKLSVLNAEEQGIGGSSSTDGYNRGQGAILNVTPVNDPEDFYPKVMTVSAISCNKATFDRGNPIEVSSNIFNFSGAERTFDMAYEVYKDKEYVARFGETMSEELQKNEGYNGFNRSFLFDESYADGIYTIYAVSKVNGVETWSKDDNSYKYFLTVTINGTEMTVATGTPDLKVTFAENTETNYIANKTYPITFTVSNNGGLYSDVVTLCLTQKNNKYTDVQTIGTKQITVTKGSPQTITINFVPTSDLKGQSFYLAVRDRDSNVIHKQEVLVENDNASSDLSLVLSADNLPVLEVQNLNKEGSGILGNTMTVKVSIKNTSKNMDYSATGMYVFYKRKKAENGNLRGSLIVTPIYVPKDEIKVFEYSTTIDSDEIYKFGFYPNKENREASDKVITPATYSIAPAVYAYDADGNCTATELEGNTYDASVAELTSVNLSGTGVTTVIPNANPNMLYFFAAEDGDVSGLWGKNVVVDGTANTITLTDGSDFATPMDFTATEISYARNNFPAADLDGGWTTILLPFDVARVTANGEEIDWFHSDEESGKRFWVREFVTDNKGSIMFSPAQTMKANTPYIIALPGNAWGPRWDLSEKDIVFHGENVTVTAQASNTVSGNNFKFIGNTATSSLGEAFVMNDEGDNFVRQQQTSEVPFRAWFAAQNWLDLEYDALRMITVSTTQAPDNGEVMGISERQQPSYDDVTVYNLKGHKVRHLAPTASFNPLKGLPKGIYIINGKKIWNK